MAVAIRLVHRVQAYSRSARGGILLAVSDPPTRSGLGIHGHRPRLPPRLLRAYRWQAAPMAAVAATRPGGLSIRPDRQRHHRCLAGGSRTIIDGSTNPCPCRDKSNGADPFPNRRPPRPLLRSAVAARAPCDGLTGASCPASGWPAPPPQILPRRRRWPDARRRGHAPPAPPPRSFHASRTRPSRPETAGPPAAPTPLPSDASPNNHGHGRPIHPLRNPRHHQWVVACRCGA